MFHVQSYFDVLASRTVPISLARTIRHVPLLNCQVNRDNTIPPVVEGEFVTHQGIVSPTGNVMAIKCLRLLSRHLEEGVGRVLCGTFIWSLLEHDNVLPLLGVTTFDNGLSTVTELIIKGNAHDYVQDPEVEPGPLLLGVAHGLRYLHGHPAGPIYHGDVTGYNVLVADDGRALLSGFEHAFIDDPSFGMAPASPAIGSLRWMAPEGIDGGSRATAERDTWAFGMTALELFTGETPFSHIRSSRLINVHILAGGRPERSTQLTEKWWDLCTLCWDSNPALRPDMTTIVSKIEEVGVLTFEYIGIT